MADALAIVSAAVFRKARTAGGAALGPRRIYPTDRYTSTHKVLRAKLTGDLYLVTVADDRLWLVAALERPVHDGEAWVARPNAQPIVDLTSIAADLRFDTGTGLDVTKMASSLQTPRGLTPSDVALLRRAIARAAADRATPEQIEAAVVRVTARILARTEDDVRADTGRYAAYHWDDGFIDEEDGEVDIDWETLALEDEEPSPELFGRRDFDLRRSRFQSDEFRPERTTDHALRGLLDAQYFLYGEQLATLIAQGRLRADALDLYQVEGRLRGGERLVDVMTSLLMLRDFDDHRLEPGEFSETDPEWAEFLAPIEPPSLRAHLSVFFQTAEAARCTGARFEPPDGDDDARLAEWWIGEGQGSCTLDRITGEIPPVPPFTRHALIRRAPPEPGSLPTADGRSDEITSTPLHEWLAGLDPDEPVRELLTGATDPQVRRQIESLRKRDPALSELVRSLDPLIESGHARAAVALASACAARVEPEHALLVEYHLCWALFTVRCWAEALTHAERTLEVLPPDDPVVPESFVHNNLAWCALHAGQLDRARTHADKAVALDPHNDRACATRADVLFAQGDEKAALKVYERLMRGGVDPEAAGAHRHPAYRKLALKYRIPVELTDAEAAELGV